MQTISGTGPPAEEFANNFATLFGQMEHAMKRCNFCVDHKDNAEADWDKLSKSLGEKFFHEVTASGKAPTLLSRRPRKLKRQPFTWLPAEALPVTNVQELFVNGIC